MGPIMSTMLRETQGVPMKDEIEETIALNKV